MAKTSSDKFLLREIAIILVIKLIVLYGIWFSFFSHEKPPVTHTQLADKLLSDKQQGAALDN